MPCLTKTCRHGLAIKTGVSPRVVLHSTPQMALLAIVSCSSLGLEVISLNLRVDDASCIQPYPSAKFLLLLKDAQFNFL